MHLCCSYRNPFVNPPLIRSGKSARILSERSLPTDLVSVEANVEFEGSHRHFLNFLHHRRKAGGITAAITLRYPIPRFAKDSGASWPETFQLVSSAPEMILCPPRMTISEFIAKWRKVELKERSAAQEHFIDLCNVFDHPTPATADPTGESFCFEKGAAKAGSAGVPPALANQENDHAGGTPAVPDIALPGIAEAARDLVVKRDRWLKPEGLTAAERKTRTLTNLYNARPTWLADCHARLDAAVATAYGWPADLSDEAILERLLALNHERTETEKRGKP